MPKCSAKSKAKSKARLESYEAISLTASREIYSPAAIVQNSKAGEGGLVASWLLIDTSKHAVESLEGHRVSITLSTINPEEIFFEVSRQADSRKVLCACLPLRCRIMEVGPGKFYCIKLDEKVFAGGHRQVQRAYRIDQTGRLQGPEALAEWFKQTRPETIKKYTVALGKQVLLSSIVMEAKLEVYCLQVLGRSCVALQNPESKKIGVLSPWVEGKEFNELYSAGLGGVSYSARIAAAEQLLQQLKMLHEVAKVIVVDISDSNVMRDKEGNWQLIDLASVKKRGYRARFVESVVRLPAYAAPEVLRQAEPLNAAWKRKAKAMGPGHYLPRPKVKFTVKSDIYALGRLLCLLFHPLIYQDPRTLAAGIRDQFVLNEGKLNVLPLVARKAIRSILAMVHPLPDFRPKIADLLKALPKAREKLYDYEVKMILQRYGEAAREVLTERMQTKRKATRQQNLRDVYAQGPDPRLVRPWRTISGQVKRKAGELTDFFLPQPQGGYQSNGLDRSVSLISEEDSGTGVQRSLSDWLEGADVSVLPVAAGGNF
jgi:serine/threonine protein kinase